MHRTRSTRAADIDHVAGRVQGIGWLQRAITVDEVTDAIRQVGPGNPLARGTRHDHPDPMDLKDAAQAWREDGFVILPGFIPPDELNSAASELELLFPSAEGFHDAVDP